MVWSVKAWRTITPFLCQYSDYHHISSYTNVTVLVINFTQVPNLISFNLQVTYWFNIVLTSFNDQRHVNFHLFPLIFTLQRWCRYSILEEYLLKPALQQDPLFLPWLYKGIYFTFLSNAEKKSSLGTYFYFSKIVPLCRGVYRREIHETISVVSIFSWEEDALNKHLVVYQLFYLNLNIIIYPKDQISNNFIG